ISALYTHYNVIPILLSFPTRRSSDLYKFNPNLKFSFKKQSFERIFPRTDFKIADKKNIISEILLNFEEQVKWLNQSDKTLYFSRSEEHTSELQSRFDLVCRLLLEKK